MTEHVKQKHLLAVDRTPRAWTVTFDPESVSPDGKRGDLARNMVANVAVGEEKVRNDFDSVPIFNRPIFNATWDSDLRCWVDLVERGEPGFTFTPTEENREVVYRCTPFWYKIGFEDGQGPTYVSVSDQPLEGYKLAPMFKNATTYEYRPCFELAIGSDKKPHSRAGLLPFDSDVYNLEIALRSYGSGAHTETMADWFSDYLLLLVEFGTRNLQGIMRGVTKGELQQTVVSDEEISPIGIYTSEPWEYGIGEIYRMVYTEEGEEYVWDVELLDISETEQEEGYQMFFDLGANSKFFHSHDDVRLYELPRATGEALRYVTNASSGKADESPYSPFVWRGKENAWGNVSSLIWDVLFQATGNYGEVEPYLLTDFSRHDIALNDAYVYCYYDPQSYFTASQSYIVSFTPAGEKDWFLIPSEFDGGSSQQYFATSAALYPGIRSFGDAHLRVGGDYSTTTAVNHATYEIVVDTGQSPRVGARLVLGEGR